MLHSSGKILLVEDDTALRKVTTIILRENGYEVIEAEDSNEVPSIIKCHKDIEILLTDLIMPGKFGHDVAREVTLAFPKVKIIVMSGFGTDALTEHFKDLGYRFLSKPASVSDLLQTLRSAIGELYDNSVAS
jgi:DNA-binding NtrC family response regulator